MSQALPGSYRAASWPEDRLYASTASRKHDELASSLGQAGPEQNVYLLTWRKQLPFIISAFESSQRELLLDVVSLLVDKVVC